MAKKPACLTLGLSLLVGGVTWPQLLGSLGYAGEVLSEPFASASGGASGRFEIVDAAESGVVAANAYADPAMWGARFEEFAYGAIGTGVAVGDYDNDGRPDLFVVGKTDPDHLFRNLGNWRFADVSAAAGVAGSTEAWHAGAVWADVDNDGWLDLFVTRQGAPNLLYHNGGDGTFTEEAAARGLDLVDASGMAAFADYDRDGWLDLYVATNLLDHGARPDGQPDRLLRNRGDGTFTEVTAAAGLGGAAQTHAAIWWDYDQDGWPDLYATNDFGWPDQLWRNQGDGTFADVISHAVPQMPRFGMGADAADVNNDGLIDLLAGDMLPTTRERDQRSMIDARAHQVDPTDRHAAPQYMRNALFLNTGTGRFAEGAWLAGLAATDWTWSLRFEDFDQDGRVDLHVTNGMVREFFDLGLMARLAGRPPAEARRIVRGAPRLDEPNLAFRNDGDLRFTPVGSAWGLDQRGVSFGAATGDFDGDGDLDLVWADYEGNVTLARNDVATGRALAVALRGVRSNRFGIGARIEIVMTDGSRQVRELQPARGYLSSSEPVAHFGLGDAARVARLTVHWPSGIVQTLNNVAVGRRYTITESADGGAAAGERDATVVTQFVEVSAAVGLAMVQPEQPVDEFSVQPLLPVRQHGLGPGLAIGDLNGDRRDDVVMAGTGAAPARLAFGADSRRFETVNLSAGEETAHAAPLLFDADVDGDLDLLLVHGGAALPADDAGWQARLWLNQDGGLTPAPAGNLPGLRTSAGPVVAADFDRDGRLDVFVGGRLVPGRYPELPRSALWRNLGDGRFADVTGEWAPDLARAGLLQAALATDADGDGWIDLLLAPHWGPVSCWRNAEGRGFADATKRLGFAAAGAGWWNSLAAADFNSDGRLDYVAGNLGLNTSYSSAPVRPAILFRGRFLGEARAHLIEATRDGGRLVPLRGRSMLGRTLPRLLREVRSAAEFADATLDAIVPAAELEDAQRFEATQFASGIFLSTATGDFRFVPLPRWAQLAPIHGLVAGDLDGDGNADLAAVQNDHNPRPEEGHFGGGLGVMLAGDGAGNFTVRTAKGTGFEVTGDARGLALLDADGDGWPDLLVTRRDEPNLFFANTGRAGHRMLGVRLAGPAGNPTAIGARVRFSDTTDRQQVREIAAGGGYQSQSTPVLHFGLAPGASPTTLEVRWPDGRITAHRLENVGRASVITVRQP